MLRLATRVLPGGINMRQPSTLLTFVRHQHTRYPTSQLNGPPGTPAHRQYFNRLDSTPISPWHDIPLVDSANSPSAPLYNMVCEIPRWTNAKLEIDTSTPFNPIKQDVKNGRLRFVPNIFPYKGYIWNYGALPQTFEDPEHCDPDTGCVGDSDPLDVVEVGQEVCEQGSVHRVKVLGLVALIDGGETDWKIFAIRADDPMAHRLNDIGDLESNMPGLVDATVDWFTKYKVPDGKPLNAWAFGGKPKDAAYAHRVIASTHEAWKRLVHSDPTISAGGYALTNASVESSKHYLTPSDASDAFKKLIDRSPGQMCPDPPPHPSASASSPVAAVVPQSAPSKWFYMRGDKVTNSD
ncbi:inorganic diphosphatase activity protein [Coemansia erecta]|uniref:inorganic diphosphatase n=1 Tax=Coemansia erecta TaxID=147472 RepID=A0A9W7XZK5_9FUNG|nr:inorganic diphosphatase activity protein [Coemansia erecta]